MTDIVVAGRAPGNAGDPLGRNVSARGIAQIMIMVKN
jgi:hypothetical protein